MKRFSWLSMWGLASTALLLHGCADPATPAPSGGSGGTSSTGGISAGEATGGTSSGGATGRGGSGGTTSSGGTSSSGGAGSGGTGSGGATGRGGGASSGGPGSGGAGGAAGAGGTKASGGTSGGDSGMGGAMTGGATGSGGSTGACAPADDTCPAPGGGMTWNCKKRFSYGVNYAWGNFAGDFGGISAWSQKGVAGEKAARTTEMTDMKNNGVDVIRWWMFPDLRGDGVKLDSSKTPTGLGATVLDDVAAALDIAKQLDLHIKLTLFSFDNFCADRTDAGVNVVGLLPIVADATKRAALIAKIVVPIAQAVEASPNKDRMVAWDVINEPEWAITGTDTYGSQKFDAQTQCSNGAAMQAMTFAQAETFVKEVVTALHGASKAPVTVGGAAVKWAKTWSQVGLDFYDFHWYGWVDQYYPHTKTPKDYGVDDKPVVVGEFPLAPTSSEFGGVGYSKIVDNFLAGGYAGAQPWAFSDTAGWGSGKANVKTWASAHTCYTHY